MKLIYIAGPYTAPTAWGIAENIRTAERLAIEVARLGAYPCVPHSIGANFAGECTPEFWYDGTMELLRRCDAIALTFNWIDSKGARLEHDEALTLRLPTFLPGGMVENAQMPQEMFSSQIAAIRAWLATK